MRVGEKLCQQQKETFVMLKIGIIKIIPRERLFPKKALLLEFGNQYNLS